MKTERFSRSVCYFRFILVVMIDSGPAPSSAIGSSEVPTFPKEPGIVAPYGTKLLSFRFRNLIVLFFLRISRRMEN